MKKIIKYILGLLILILIFTNTSETDFIVQIDNSKDPLSEYYLYRVSKNAKPIYRNSSEYFTPVYHLEFSNYGLFSTATIESGWFGTLRIDGYYLGEKVDKVKKDKYLLILGKTINL